MEKWRAGVRQRCPGRLIHLLNFDDRYSLRISAFPSSTDIVQLIIQTLL